MVLSENNESYKKSEPLQEVPETNVEMDPVDPPPSIDPSIKLRSIEMESSLEIKKSDPFSFLKKIKKPNFPKLKISPLHIGVVLSFVLNIILLVALLSLGREVFQIKKTLIGDVLGSMYLNLGKMDKTSLTTQVSTKADIQAEFPLQIDQETEVILVSDTTISGATITISTGGLNISSAPASIVLPAGTRLPVKVNMTVPVTASIPIELNSPVEIPLAKTDLHTPITDLQNVIEPTLLNYMNGPISWKEIPGCKVFVSICKWWYEK